MREAEALGADADPSAEELHGWHEAAEAAGSPEAELLADIALVFRVAVDCSQRSNSDSRRVVFRLHSTIEEHAPAGRSTILS